MKNKKKSSPILITVFVLAIALLLVGGIGGTKAALTYYSDEYVASVDTKDIGVTLYERGQNGDAQKISTRNYDGKKGSWNETSGDLLTTMLGEGEEKVIFGKEYREEMYVENSGTIPEYVRATVYKYWKDAEDNKVTNVSPALINLQFDTTDGWMIDPNKAANTDEKTVLYYKNKLGVGDKTSDFTKSITVFASEAMLNTVKETKTEVEGNSTKITTTYAYNGYQFVVEVEVDAIQDHNPEEAALASWGRAVTVNGGTLSLK